MCLIKNSVLLVDTDLRDLGPIYSIIQHEVFGTGMYIVPSFIFHVIEFLDFMSVHFHFCYSRKRIQIASFLLIVTSFTVINSKTLQGGIKMSYYINTVFV